MSSNRALHAALVAVASLVVFGCFRGPGNTPGEHAGNGIPLVVVSPPAGLATGNVILPLEIFDAEGDSVRLWDLCPYPGADPILSVGYSVDGGNNFLPILVTDLVLDSAAIAVPTCDEVESGAANTIAATANGRAHELGWTTKPYVPTDARVVIRLTVSDGFNSSDPGESEEFLVTNAPRLDVVPRGARPSDVLASALLQGQLTHWSLATTSSSADLVLAGFTVTSTTAATVNITMPAAAAQIPHSLATITVGAGKGGTDEIARGILWTCPAYGGIVTEFETEPIGDVDQFLCTQGGPALHFDGAIAEAANQGGTYSGDGDFYVFVATSAWTVSATLQWASGNGAATDYDLYLTSLDSAQDVFDLGCADVAKPETCNGGPLVAGDRYLVEVYGYEGEAVDYDLDLVFQP